MPRAKSPPKRDLFKAELAERLGVPLDDVMTRDEAANLLGKHPKTFSNDPLTSPLFYKAPLGKEGLALYALSDLRMWRDDKSAFGRLRATMKTNERPWPPASTTPPAAPVKSNVEALLDNLKVDEDYKAKVLGRQRWT